jgi:hypothetical protein
MEIAIGRALHGLFKGEVWNEGCPQCEKSESLVILI